MIETRRRAYLEAMGFDVWVARSAAQAETQVEAQAATQFDAGADEQWGRIQVGPGRGSTLLVCAAAAESASKFAADVVRALGGDPAWAWPGGGAGGDSCTLEEAIGAGLITRVFVFGDDAARWLFQGEIPSVVGSATVTSLAGLGEISRRGAAKQALWRCLQDPLRSAPPGGGGPSAA